MHSSVAAPAAFAGPAAVRRRAILGVLGAGFCFAVAAALIKATKPAGIPTFEMVVFRSVVIALVMTAVLRRQGGVLAALRTPRPGAHAVRTVLGFIAMTTTLCRLRAAAAGDRHRARLRDAAVPDGAVGAAARRDGGLAARRRGGGRAVGVLIIVRPWHAPPPTRRRTPSRWCSRAWSPGR